MPLDRDQSRSSLSAEAVVLKPGHFPNRFPILRPLGPKFRLEVRTGWSRTEATYERPRPLLAESRFPQLPSPVRGYSGL